jgi:hypothetical protein
VGCSTRDSLRKGAFCQSAKILKKLLMKMIILAGLWRKEASVARLLSPVFDNDNQISFSQG